MTIFTQYEEKPLTLKCKLAIWAMIFTITPLLAYAYGNHEYKQSTQYQHSLPVEVALPEQLPNNTQQWEF